MRFGIRAAHSRRKSRSMQSYREKTNGLPLPSGRSVLIYKENGISLTLVINTCVHNVGREDKGRTIKAAMGRAPPFQACPSEQRRIVSQSSLARDGDMQMSGNVGTCSVPLNAARETTSFRLKKSRGNYSREIRNSFQISACGSLPTGVQVALHIYLSYLDIFYRQNRGKRENLKCNYNN